MNILIVKLSAIGDVIHTLPAVNSLRARFPEARITWLVEEAAAPLVTGHEALDRVLVSRRKTWLRQLRTTKAPAAIREIWGFVRELRDDYYDIILDFQALLKSGLLIRLARGKRKIGFGPGMEHQEHSYIFLNERLPAVSMETHALVRNLKMVEPLGVTPPKIEYRLPITDADRNRVQQLLDRKAEGTARPFAAVNPVAKWDTKLWASDRFAQLADLLVRQRGLAVVFTGGPEDAAVIKDIQSMMRQESISLAGRTSLIELAALYEQAAVVISTDTGPMHIAAAVGAPVVALFGPTAPRRTGPFGENNRVVRAELTCSPCFQRSCDTCQCMQEITVDRVLTAVSELCPV